MMSEIATEVNISVENQNNYSNTNLTKSLYVICKRDWKNVLENIKKNVPWQNIYVIRENLFFELIVDCPKSQDLEDISNKLIKNKEIAKIKYEK